MNMQIIKKKWLLSTALTLMMACNKDDIRDLRNDLNAQKERIDQLEVAVEAINGDVKTLQDLTAALQKNVSIKSYTATSTGYLLTMSDGNSIELKNGAKGTNGKDGKDGANAPTIGVKKDTDSVYYWTLAGQFLLQDGKKLRVTGNNGTNGQDGEDGTNGVTPQLKVDNTANTWLISYDGDKTWTTVKDTNGNPVPATGEQGAQGPQGQQGQQGAAGIPGFTISDTDDNMVITYQGNSYVFPKGDNGSAYKMVFETALPLNSSITLNVGASLADRADVWIDLNNNKTREANENFADLGGGSNTFVVSSTTVTIYGKVSLLYMANQQLTHLDVSKNTALGFLNCDGNQLQTLDVSNTALTELYCRNNQLTALDVSKNTALQVLYCLDNRLTALDVSKNKNTALRAVVCYGNQIKDANMTVLINSLPPAATSSSATAIIYDATGGDGNVLPSTAEIKSANAKNWVLLKRENNSYSEIKP